MSACQLIRRRLNGARGTHRVIVPLHAAARTLEELIPFSRAIDSEAAICAPQAPRCLDAVFSSRPHGVETGGGAATGFAWFRSEAGPSPDGAIDPMSFADSVWHVEELVRDLRREGFGWIVLVGRGEGALVGLAARRGLGALLAGVVALGPGDAELPSWARAEPAAPDLAPLLALSDGPLEGHRAAVARWLRTATCR